MMTMERRSTLQRMDERIAQWEQEVDKRIIFLRCYRMMTANMLQALQDGAFQDATWVEKLLDHFADYYFDALTCWECGDEVPAVWQQVHELSCTDDLYQVQHLLLGVNAHINYDLVFALYDLLRPEWGHLSAAQQASRYRDHCTVNDVIGATIDRVQDELLEPSNWLIAVMDRVCGRLDEYLISRLITQWRQEVWETTQSMLAQKTATGREALRQKVEADVCRRAQLLGT